MSIAIISGSAGLIGSEAAVFFAESRGLQVVGIDNDMRRTFFGDEASTSAISRGSSKGWGRSTPIQTLTFGMRRPSR